MRNFYSKLFFLLLPALSVGQLHIKSSTGGSNAYVFNNGEIIYVNQEIGMDGNPDQTGGNLYLRNEGQLIQGENSSNSGTGIVSVYQENTRNAWDYHMWASPVGDPNESNPNNGNAGNARFYLDSGNGGGVYQVIDELDSDAATFSASYNGIAAPLTLSTTWLYKYIATQGYSGWSKISSGNPLLPGEGFSMKGVGSGTTPTSTAFDFRGIPNNGNIEVDVKPTQRTLVGNPYPSALNLSYYLLYNSGQSVANCLGTYSGTPSTGTEVITGEAFFWESDPNVQSHYLADYLGGYGTFTPLMDCTSLGEYTSPTYVMYNEDGTVRSDGPSIDTDDPLVNEIERKIAPIGQGFFVLGRDLTASEQTAVDGGAPLPTLQVTMKNDFRVFIKETNAVYDPEFKNNSSSKGAKTAQKNGSNSSLNPGGLTYTEDGILIMPKFVLSTVVNHQYVRTLKGIMYESATLGFDRAGDGENRSSLPSDINFLLEDSDKSYLMNIFPYQIENKLALKLSGANPTNTYEIKVTDINFTPDESIYLHDKLTDEYHDILDESYEFELEQGTYTDRFEIVFKDSKTLDVEEVEEVKRSFNIYQNNGRAELTVLNPLQTELKEVNVFDISGRLLVSKLNEGTSEKVIIPSNAWSDGVYIVRVTTRDNIEYTKKVSVRNIK
ncbi:T9SS type A sorting domain-containing protein [Leeuwenhoekiella palythoae]|uniref:Por secretion system C-terminal sorting domain-containing protein n=1 Tax=Leeuwenhoekiella palythoae TaxID=573501 RepID=A0A1M5SFJ7_9FLAO|nr:T9SS sorting signal type C domain-containing protein [Leeuwenhoekiella palythoae]RXG28991.1 putative secreted protein (Por secretion system target) [Leeuwenhoekiella palythoae]SHH36653.1 Por secretion system C-terminal sorting domain-containing protein [Leeuwenhoekiella palythoae]